MAPFDVLNTGPGSALFYLVPLLIGMAFGAVLEMSGFGDSRKLAAQFYFREMTVLKVMFTGIVVAMVLVFLASAFQILDFERVWVNPTYLWPGIVGGLIMGVGFIIGGFCPGTSVVAFSTLKVDGIFFVAGVGFGVYLFGESVSGFQSFFDSSYMGRLTLPALFGLPTGVVVILVVFMALAMFYGAELSERVFGREIPWKSVHKRPHNTRKLVAAAAIVFLALVVLFRGQPTVEDRWTWIQDEEEAKLAARDVYIHPGELLETMNDNMLYTNILDVRSLSDFNLFHLEGANRVEVADLRQPALVREIIEEPPNTVNVLVSNDEEAATEAYKLLRAQGVLNLYILSRGVNNWLETFHVPPALAQRVEDPGSGQADQLAYTFSRALGSTSPVSNPGQAHGGHTPSLDFEKKIKMQKKKKISGGCG